jgi:radical SAM superfamily enzyme YgiQ (UPF0313 family)
MEDRSMRLYLVNPSNPLVSLVGARRSRWNRFRIWKPLGLMVVAGLTPPQWEIRILDENQETPDYSNLPRPDVVGITAFTSQAPRAYQLGAGFRADHIPVVMGGIHATMCPGEALEHVDSIVTGEAESVWGRVLEDARRGKLKKTYDGGNVDLATVPAARQDMLAGRYAFGSIQTSRGCPLNCSFCSVTAFNGALYRHRPIENVIKEFRSIKEKYILFVDDNLIGTRKDHLERAKELFRAIIDTKLHKRWVCQATASASRKTGRLLRRIHRLRITYHSGVGRSRQEVQSDQREKFSGRGPQDPEPRNIGDRILHHGTE